MNQAGISICVQTVLWGHKNVPIFAASGAGINVKRIFKENLLGMLLLWPNLQPSCVLLTSARGHTGHIAEKDVVQVDCGEMKYF